MEKFTSRTTMANLCLALFLLIHPVSSFLTYGTDHRKAVLIGLVPPGSVGGPRREYQRKIFDLKVSNGDVPSTKSLLHPVTIDALTKAMRLRAQNDPKQPLRVQGDIEALDVALTAGKIAAEAVDLFRVQCTDSSTPEMEQTIAGRIVGIILRFDVLEQEIRNRVQDSNKITLFGLMENESSLSRDEVDQTLAQNEGLALARAKALLATFLHTVEAPAMKRSGSVVPDNSIIDFLEDDNWEVFMSIWNKVDDSAPFDSYDTESNSSLKGDKVRAATGIRPSLHPVTINAIADGLKLRAQNKKFSPLRKMSDVEEIDIMMTAGSVAQNAIRKRQKASTQDGMTLLADEERTVAGRIVAVLMRLEDLEKELQKRCANTKWVSKYNEWHTFGILHDESQSSEVDQKVLSDPLFAMNRAECLLALFLHEIERPGMEKSGENIPGGSKVDFLDSDRMEVVLGASV